MRWTRSEDRISKYRQWFGIYLLRVRERGRGRGKRKTHGRSIRKGNGEACVEKSCWEREREMGDGEAKRGHQLGVNLGHKFSMRSRACQRLLVATCEWRSRTFHPVPAPWSSVLSHHGHGAGPSEFGSHNSLEPDLKLLFESHFNLG